MLALMRIMSESRSARMKSNMARAYVISLSQEMTSVLSHYPIVYPTNRISRSVNGCTYSFHPKCLMDFLGDTMQYELCHYILGVYVHTHDMYTTRDNGQYAREPQTGCLNSQIS